VDTTKILGFLDTWELVLVALLFISVVAYGVYDRYIVWKESELKWWQFFNPFKRLSSPFEVKTIFISFGIFIFVIIMANLVYFLFLK
jgi:hypothetical protein